MPCGGFSIARSRTIAAEGDRDALCVRPALPQDLAAIQSVYAPAVTRGLASFEEEAPSVDEMLRRYAEVVGRGLPYFVAERGGEVVGYGYCTHYRTRSAYRYVLEDSVYVREGLGGSGIGSALLAQLIHAAEGLGYRQMIAVIGDSGNSASIRLHARFGFLRVGTLRSAGFKLGRWVDSVLMQRPLGPGDSRPPTTPRA